VIAGIGPAQWSAPTPCPAWNVADLTDHVVAGNRRFASALRGEQAPPSHPGAADADADVSGAPDRLGAYRRSVDDLYEACAAPGALDRIVSIPFGQVPGAVALHLRVVELAIHGWDLARATGQRIDVPDDVVRAELEFTRQTLPRVPADRMPFGPPQPAGEAASALDQLAAQLGRTGWGRCAHVGAGVRAAVLVVVLDQAELVAFRVLHDHDHPLVVVVPLSGPAPSEGLHLLAPGIDVVDLHVEMEPHLCALGLRDGLEGEPRLGIEA
jgi:uncharacterized protein (TIGR03086 family)